MSQADHQFGAFIVAQTMAKIARYEARLAESNAKTKTGVLEALAAAGVAKVTVIFEGSGDSGAIEDVEVVNADGQPVGLPTTPVAYYTAAYSDEEAESSSEQPLADAVDNLAMAYLAQTHGGWENNEGAFGDVIFDVAAGTVSLDYNERFSDSELHEHVF